VQRIEVRRHVVPADPHLVRLTHRRLPALRAHEERPRRLTEAATEAKPQDQVALVELVLWRVPATEAPILTPALQVGLEMVQVTGR
jgi:hypothetical protein